MFDLDKASASYNGRVVLSDISLTVRPGERVALVGESGAGKSTLLNLLYQQHQAQSALIPQDPALVRTLSVFHNVYIGCLHRHKSFYNLLNLVRPRSRVLGHQGRLGLVLLVEEVEQRRLAGAALAHQRHPLARPDSPGPFRPHGCGDGRG